MKTSILVVLATALAAATPAEYAWRTVVDPSNYTQNVMTAARALEQINNQIQQLQNEGQMLVNQGRNLATLNFDSINRLRSTLAATPRLVDEARGLTFDVSRMDADFSRLYPVQSGTAVTRTKMVNRKSVVVGTSGSVR